jgi:hypothetical protein
MEIEDRKYAPEESGEMMMHDNVAPHDDVAPHVPDVALGSAAVEGGGLGTGRGGRHQFGPRTCGLHVCVCVLVCV